jgi:hypothetical protein
MGRGQGKGPQWQTIVLLAAFLAGEAANDARANTTAKYRGQRSEEEYASWLRKLDKDDGMQGKGIKFVEKVVGSTKLKWTLWRPPSCPGRATS